MSRTVVGRQTGAQDRVFAYLVDYGPATGPEMAEALGMTHDSVRKAVVRLEDSGELARCGLRTGTRGRPPVLWAIPGDVE